MPNVTKTVPSIIRRTKKDDSSDKEYKFLNALVQLGLSKLLESVKTDKTLLSARELRDLHTMKSIASIDNIDEAGMYFVACNACLFHKSCTLFASGADCKFNLRGDFKNSKDIVTVLMKLLQIESDRIQRALLIEKMDGAIDREISAEIMQYFEMVNQLKSIMSKEESVEIKIRGRGAISQIFGNMLPKPVEPEPIFNTDSADGVIPVKEAVVVSPVEETP